MYYIYKHTNSTNNKAYIGITSTSIEKRFQQHIKYSIKHKNTNRPFYSALRKYPIEVWITECIGIVETKKEACELEKKFIQEHGTHYTAGGYNVTVGGDGFMGASHSTNSKLRASLAQRGIPKNYPNGRKGKELTSDHRAKLSKDRKYSKITEDQFKFIKSNMDKMSFGDLASKLNTDIATIKRWANRDVFKNKKRNAVARRTLSYDQHVFLITNKNSMTLQQIAEKLGVKRSLLKKWAHKQWDD